MDNPPPATRAADPTQQNIETIAKLEHDALSRRTTTERVSELVTQLVGNMGFLLFQLLLISGWILINLHVIPGLKPFDPLPFGVLALLVSSEGVFLTVFVLITQSRMARQSDRRSHLGLQVNMLSEQELTTILQMLQKLCQHMGVNVESSRQEVQSFSKTTEIHKLASELEDKLPEK
ncbi:MAG TPA: DUF1003 domain-containing protein [Candidatus Acidoferrales bacterium]|jgi:uncharacterized membrane protein|nr:DUF1003 domain-containing protein [Candidatus Acidoferrales bacterium]